MSAPDQIEAIKQELRDRGLSATTARVAVLQLLSEEHEHRSVDEIRTAVLARYPAIDPATVYRTLETLEERHLVVRVVLGDRVTRWAHVHHRHHHLVCRMCGAVVELDNAPFADLARELRRIHGVVPDMDHLILRGLCPSCARTVSSDPQ